MLVIDIKPQICSDEVAGLQIKVNIWKFATSIQMYHLKILFSWEIVKTRARGENYIVEGGIFGHKIFMFLILMTYWLSDLLNDNV